MSSKRSSGPDFSGSGPVDYQPEEDVGGGPAALLLAREEARLLSISGVTSVGVGLGPLGGEAITIGVVDAGVARLLPRDIEGIPVIAVVTGPVDAQAKR
jgi:hypothetical protein